MTATPDGGTRLVIFDFDGTLADSGDPFLRVLNEVADRYRFRRVDAAEIAMLRGQDNRAVIRHLGVPRWKLPLIARHMRRRVAAEAGAIRLFPGVPAMLTALAEGGIALAIVSSNAEATIRRILGPELAGRIAFWECGVSLFGKASRFRRLLRRSGIARADALCVGDEARDLDAARQAGLRAAAVTWGYATAALLESRRPDLIFRSVEEIPARLLRPGPRTEHDVRAVPPA